MHNLIVGGHAGLSVWHSKGGAPTTDHVFAHNLVRGARLSLHIQQSPQFIAHNVYWPPSGRDLAAIGGHQCKGIEDVRRVSGYEAGGEVIDASPEDMGLGVVTFRVRDRKDDGEILMMVGNNGCELRDPVDNNDLPYFWRPGTGDGREHLFRFWPYTGLKPAREAHSGVMYSYGYRGKCGGTLAFAAFQGQAARTGRRCLEVDGQRPERIPEQGLGWWSPSLPARPGDTIDVGFWVRGRDLKPVGAKSALAAFAQFTSYTGQMKRTIELAPAAALGGTFGWREVRARVSVPEPARRVAFFFGLKPATGAVFLDDFSIDVEGADAVNVEPVDQPTGDGRIVAMTAIVRAGPMLHARCDLSKYPDLRADDQLRVRVKRQWRSLAAKVLPVSPEKRESTVIFNITDWPPDRYQLYVEVLTADFRVRSGRRVPFVIPRRDPGAETVKEHILLAGLWRAAMTAPLPQVEGLDKVYADKGMGAAARKLVEERADLSSMREVSVPGAMQDYGEGWQARNGEAVFRRTVVIPPNWIGKNLVLSLGPIDDFDVTFFNGVQVGATDETTPKFYAHPRLYTVPAALPKLGENVIAVRVFDRGWGGGLMGKPEQMFLAPCE